MRSVMDALTNTAGVTANIGFSKSRSTSETHAEIVSGSTVTGHDVLIIADRDATVRGSDVSATNDLMIDAGRDILLESAQNRIETETSSGSVGVGVGVQVGVGVGGVSASANVSASASKSEGTSSATTHTHTHLSAGERLVLGADRDVTLSGAIAEGRDVDVDAGRNLTITSVQDMASHHSSGGSISAGISLSSNGGKPEVGGNGSVSMSNGEGWSAVVGEQSAIIAQGGTLRAEAGSTTTLNGGLLAAFDENGHDSGKLALSTRTLQVTDIVDSAKSREISIGVSASINDPFEAGISGATTPVIDGRYAASVFGQDTRGTIGQGSIAIGDPANSTALSKVNRDPGASQVVTKDSKTGFTVYIDEAAIRETIALATGNAEDSVIIRGFRTLGDDPFAMLKDVIAEIQSFSDDIAESGAIEQLTGGIERLIRGKDAVDLDQLKAEVNDPLLNANP